MSFRPAFGLVALLLAGCAGQELVATPNLLAHQDPERYFALCPPPCQSGDMQILYATDRALVSQPRGPSYGYGRSRRLAFGTATTRLDPQPTWKELIAASTTADRPRPFQLRGAACQEIGSFDADGAKTPRSGIELCSATTAAEADESIRSLHELLRSRLAQSSQKDVYVFIHGFNNSFDDAIFRSAQVWHFMGRVGVPIAYTWPAGRGGPFGYLYDRESGEFTIYHLKQFLANVARCPDVERVHVIAHSRGTDVAITALRELHIACRAQGRSTQEALKLENLVLAAPDLDEDVFVQRFIAEDLLSASRRTTIYVSPNDHAIEAADYVFSSKRRVGQLGPRDFSPPVRQALAQMPQLQFVECRVTHFSTSHDYVFAHPAALSDLLVVLRHRASPGAENGRPLRQPVEGIWELGNDYLRQREPVVQAGSPQPK